MPPRPKRRPKPSNRPIEVLFIAGFGPIVSDPVDGPRLYESELGIPFE